MKSSLVYFSLLLFTSSSLFAEKFKVDTEGREIGYVKWGKGKHILVFLPGIGDLKENYLDLANEMLDEATIYALDLRGLGESSVNFESYGADETGKDLAFFLEQMDLKNVTIVSNSMSSASSIYAASRLNDRVSSIVLTGPFVRDEELGLFLKSAIGLMFSGPWGPSMFKSFYKDLYPVNKPSDLESHSNRIKENLEKEGRLKAVRSMFYARKPESFKSIQNLKSKVIIVIGDKDPDYDDPLKEAEDLAKLTNGKYYLFENCGHYPYKEEPKKLRKILLELWQKK